MMKLLRAAMVVSMMLAVSDAPGAWQTRDAGAGTLAGTAVISGVIVADDVMSSAVARAVVVLRGAEVQPAVQLVTDDAGRFSFRGLPPGSFTVTASRPGHLSMSYGQRTPGQGSGLPLAIESGQQIADVRIVLPRASAISGVVRDEAGQPVENAPILVAQYRSISGERTLVRAGTSRNTDSHGAFRAYGLAPGDYVVCAFRPGDFLGLPQNCRAGAGESVRAISAAEVQWAMQQLRTPTPAPAPPAAQPVSFGSTFYPRSPDASGAVSVTLGRGEERDGIDIVMLRRPVSRIDATIIGLDGRPAAGATVQFSDGFGRSSRNTPDGTFSAADLWPGRYTLSARARDASATLDIVVDGHDITGLVLRLQPVDSVSASFSGRVVFDAATLAPPETLTGIRISLVSSPSMGLLSAMVTPDGTFSISGVDPGRYRVQASIPSQGAGPGWLLQSAMVRGQDGSDAFFDVASGQAITDAVVTFTDHPSELSGTLRDGADRPAPGFYVVVIPADAAFWRQGARRMPPPVRSATDGRFRFANLPAGSYHLVALTDINQNDLYDEAFVRSLLPAAVGITLTSGEKKVQDLKLVRP